MTVNTPAKTAAFRIRPRTDADLDACVRTLSTVHEQNAYPLNWPTDPAGWLTPRSLLAVWVAEGEGGEGIIGHIVLSHSEADDAAAALWSDGPTAVINRLYIEPAARGRGVGAALMERAVAEAELRALHPVLDVASSDKAAASLYERLGWTLLAAEVEQEWGPGQRVTVRCYAAPGP
ncbi:GNAT family N-acetyltransferase [Streptomyces turgidiscabies]|uniref:Ribosomal protein S18 acetylase RimI-like enzyme n=1 Tax=Streptomyces turgidiscabies TaxID=85558 RepID=A0ABU0RS68_9ACTN|nr:GNAT family N-acetyltransferase [Streptomyces turgidiscabies]MDQ0934841.1 ribosomal protein S18 acetylase RimI-like enzyme [Streptomyces turgidiscabies]